MDNEIREFFEDWKEADKRYPVPDLPEKRSTPARWWYAAAVVIMCASVYMITQDSTKTNKPADSIQPEPAEIISETTDIYEWESPTESLASDF